MRIAILACLGPSVLLAALREGGVVVDVEAPARPVSSPVLEEMPVIGFRNWPGNLDELRPRAQTFGVLSWARPRFKGRFLRALAFGKPDNNDFRFPKSLTFDLESRGDSHFGCARNRGSIKRLGLGRLRSRCA